MLPMYENILKIRTGFFLVCALLIFMVTANANLSASMKNLTADEMATLALKDSMYYHFDEWFVRFQVEINRLESAMPSIENRVELMKFHFNYAGLLG